MPAKKILLMLFTFAGLGLAKPVYVFENLSEFEKFQSAPEMHSPMRSRLAREDGGLVSAQSPFRRLNDCPNHTKSTCSCSCSCPVDSGDSGDSDDSDESENFPDPNMLQEGSQVADLSDFSPNALYCLIVLKTKKVLKVEANMVLRQQNSADCQSGSKFRLADVEDKGGHLLARIQNGSTGLTLAPKNLRNNVEVVWETFYNASDNTQKWKIVKSQYKDGNKSWFVIENSTKKNVFDIRGGSYGLSDVIAYPYHGHSNQVYGFKVVKNLPKSS